MAACGDELLGALKGFGELHAFFRGQCLLKLREVVTLLFLDVLGEVIHQALDGRFELRIGALHVLKDFELFFELEVKTDISSCYKSSWVILGGEGSIIADEPYSTVLATVLLSFLRAHLA